MVGGVPGLTIAVGSLDTLGPRVSRAAPAHRYVIITDAIVGPLYAARAAASFADGVPVLTVPAGETHKTRATWASLSDEMLARGYARDSTVVALGGGVIGDLAGFVAATYMRGVPVVQVPTTLLAMIDAAIGGKTGVDTPAGKNLVGAFHQPAAVIIDPGVLGTLPPRVLRAGFAEAIKHGVIADAGYFERTVAALPHPTSDEMLALIAGSIAIKSAVVARDEREGGVRKILNFGHTIGHAVETLSGFALLHGEAVAIGMVAESRLAERLGVAEPGTEARVRIALQHAQLPVTVPRTLPAERVIALTHSDKKVRRDRVEYALPSALGRMANVDTTWAVSVSDAEALAALAEPA